MRSRALLLVMMFLGFGQACLGVDFWEKKRAPEWSKSETQRLLEDSPWAQQFTFGDVNISVSQRSMSAAQEATPRITYTVQLRSAQILRQAVIRKSQFDLKYDALSPEQRARFDAKALEYISTQDDALVVYVVFSTNDPQRSIELRRFWRNLSTPRIYDNVRLNLGGKKLAPTDFTMSGDDAFQVSFARPTGLLPDDKFSIEIYAPGPTAVEKILAEFKLKKMLVDGVPQF